MTDVYRRLAVDFPDIADLVEARRVKGLESFDGREFSPSLKATWMPDVEEELGDALVYLEAEIDKAAKLKRASSEAWCRWTVLRAARRKIADAVWDLREAMRVGPGFPPKKKRP